MPTSNKGGAGASPRQRAVKKVTRAQRELKKYGFVGASERSNERDRQAANRRAQHEPKAEAAGKIKPKPLEAGFTGLNEHQTKRLAHAAGTGANVGMKTLNDVADAAIHSPGGMYAVGKAVGTDLSHANTRDRDLSFKNSRAIARATVHSTVEDFRHPGRHPGYTLLDLLALASAGAGTAARVGEAGRLVKAGEVGSAAKALVKAPAPGTRTYHLNDLEVATPNSKNALVRAGQKLHARSVNKSVDEGRKAKVVGKHLKQKQRALNSAERASAEALSSRGRHLSSPQETALRAVHEETPLETTIQMHHRELRTVKRGSQRHADLRQKVLLAEAAKRYVDNVNGKPVLKTEYRHLRRSQSPARMAEVSGRIGDVAAEREHTLEQAGKLNPDAAAQRKSAPGRIARGARYEKPTLAKMGVPSKGLVRQRAIVSELEKRHAKGLERAAKKGKPYPDVTVKVPGKDKTVTREMSLAEAEARLAELDKTYEAAVKKIEPHVDPYQGESNVMDVRGRMRSVKQEEQRFRNMKSGKGGAGARYHEKGKSVGEEVRGLAEDKLDALAAKHPDQQFAKDIAERDRLRAAIGEHKFQLGDTVPPLGKVTKMVKTKSSTSTLPSDLPARNVLSNPINTRVGGALSVARDRLERMEAAAAKRKKPVGIVGAESFTGGRSRIPYAMENGKRMAPSQSTYRGGEPRKPGSLRHPYTGALQRSGGYRTKSSRLVAESGIEAQRYADVLRLRDQVVKGSVEHLPADHENYLAVRVGNVKTPPELANLEHKVEEGVRLTGDEKRLLSDAFDNWKNEMFAEPTTLKSYKGYRFVRRELLGKINEPRLLANVAHYKALRGAGHVVSETNNAIRTSLLYLAPKYAIPNIGGNVFLNVSQQGLRTIPNFYRTLKVVDRDPDLAAKFRSSMGEGFARQLEATSGITRRVSEPLSHGWSKIVDEKFRESALLDELGKLGFKTRDQLHSAFDDPHNQPKLVEAIQRARESIGDYERLSAVEKDVVRHAIFFYTWLKVSARLSKMFLVDRPIQSAGIVGLGRLGEQRQQQDLGPVPSYMEPLFKVGGSKDHPSVANASALNVFTAADLTKSLLNLAKGEHNQSGYQVADNLSPFFSLAVAAITGRDPFTQQPIKGNLAATALNQLTGGLPQLALKHRLKRAKTDQSSKAYTYTTGQALGQFGLGPLGPHGLNTAPTHELAAKEHLADVGPSTRARVTVFQRRQKFFVAAKAQSELVDGRLPKPLRDAFDDEAARQGAYATATHKAKAKAGTAEYHHARLKVDAHLLLARGKITRQVAHQILTWSDEHAHDIDQLKAYRRYLSDTFYQADDGHLTVISQWHKWLADHGGKDLG